MHGARVRVVLRVAAQLRSAAPLPPRPAAAAPAPAPAALSVSSSSKSKDKKKDKKKGTVKISRDDIGGPTNFVYAPPAILRRVRAGSHALTEVLLTSPASFQFRHVAHAGLDKETGEFVFPPEFIEAMKKINLTQVRGRQPVRDVRP